MIKIKDLSIKNFLSVGNIIQAINFNKQDLILVLGENLDLGGDDNGARNGVGKTCIINAISYALYGQAISNIKKENLINRTNGKNMVVTIDFECNDKNYRIIRGRKPNILRFYIDSVEQNTASTTNEDENSGQGDSRETQQEIERTLGLSHDMFTQIIGLNTYTIPFLDLKVNEQRTIIEQLLGITLLSEKAEKLKNDVKITKEKITVEEVQIKSSQAANARIQEQINAMVRREKLWDKQNNEGIVDLVEAIKQLGQLNIEEEIQNHELLKKYNENVNLLKQINTNITKCTKDLNRENSNLEAVEIDLANLKQQKCHTCDQKISTDVHQELLTTKQVQKKEISKLIKQYKTSLLEFETQKTNTLVIDEPIVFYNDLNSAYDHKNQLGLLNQQKEQKEAEKNPYTEQITEMQKSAIVTVSMDKINELTKQNEHQEFLLKLLTNKDSFIRKKIIEQNLNYLNSRLSHYLNKMGLPHEVTFVNDLSVNITELGRDLDFGNLSRGERNRLILSLNWSFRDVWESLYQRINLIFHDEILDNGLDAAGVENALHILKEMNRTSKRDVWIVSHREELTSRVNNVFKVQKLNGFTEFSQD